MAKYVPDSKTQRWVIIAETRSRRPDVRDIEKKEPAPFVCPFCPGNELLTPPEVYRIGGSPGDSNWQVRVVPNKFPITDLHEVIIHSPSDTDDIDVLPLDQVTRIVTAYRDRFRTNNDHGQVLLFCNHGLSAGASLTHPHSQLVVVPRQINLDAVGLEPITNVVEENDHYTAYCPDFSQWPYEVWIAPKTNGTMFCDVTDTMLPDLAGVLSRALQRIKAVLQDPDQPVKQQNEPFVYNYYIYHGYNWFIRIIPRSIHRAGFELGTGLSVNVIDPREASDRLKRITL